MAADRDIGVALARVLGSAGTARRPRGWEMLAATGVRGLRILNESSWLGSLLLTEADPEASRVLAANAERYASLGAVALPHDARGLPPGGPFDFVDLDPYGTPEPFLGTALDALTPDGLLAVTATDLRVLAGVERGACELRYAARPVRGRLGPEAGLRILLAWIARAAADRSRAMRPIAAYVRDHHVRAYLRVGPATGGVPPPIALIDPAHFTGPRLPAPGPFGPLWVGPLLDPEIAGALAPPPTSERPRETERFLARLREEAGVDAPFYYEPNELARALPLERPPAVAPMLELLHRRGWPAARTHARAAAFRTPAPLPIVEAIAREVSEGSGDANPRTPGSGRSSAPP